MMVQRVLAAKSLSHAQGATLMAGFIKLFPLFIIVIPGMISRILYPGKPPHPAFPLTSSPVSSQGPRQLTFPRCYVDEEKACSLSSVLFRYLWLGFTAFMFSQPVSPEGHDYTHTHLRTLPASILFYDLKGMSYIAPCHIFRGW